jgi:hypothetical protein
MQDKDMKELQKQCDRREEEGMQAVEEVKMRVSALQQRIVTLEEDNKCLGDRVSRHV